DGSVIKPFDNATPVTIQPGDEHDTDLIDVALEQGDTFYILTYVSVASVGMKWPLGNDREAGTPEGIAQGNLAYTGGTFDNAPSERYFHAIAIRGYADSSVPNPDEEVIATGDSITAGSGGS